jgi:hypothetical protein
MFRTSETKEEVFVILQKGLTGIEDDKNEEGIPILSLHNEPLYLHWPKDALAALTIFIEGVEQSKNKGVSSDLEYLAYNNGRESGDPALLTLATINCNKVLAIHISRMGTRKGQVLKSIKALLG